MAETAIYRYRVNLINSEAINFKTVVNNPRVYKPQDLQAAAGNLEIVPLHGGDPNPYVHCLVEYIVTEFFSMAHRTGLYNRQKVLWESVSRISDVEVFQHTKGIFRKNPLPIFDLHFLDHKRRILIMSRLAQPDAAITDKALQRLVKSLIHKAATTEFRVGLFLCSGEPFPASVCQYVAKMTSADDPVGRYESLLPEPISIPLNLLAIGTPAGGEGEAAVLSVRSIRLVHPDLTVSRRAHAASVDDPKPD